MAKTLSEETMVKVIQIPFGDFFPIASDAVTFILGVLAFCLSIYFFIEAKKTEQANSQILADIKAQVDLLQRFTNKQLDKLTKYVVDQRPQVTADISSHVTNLIARIPDVITSSFHNVNSIQGNNVQMRRELIDAYIAIYNYAAETNFWAQKMLPYNGIYNPEEPLSKLASTITDRSKADFQILENILNQIPVAEINASAVKHLYDQAKALKEFVKPVSVVLQERGVQIS